MTVDKRKRIYMNGVDRTDWFTPRGMKVGYIKVLGENGGTYLSGEREEDILAWKAVVTLTCMPLLETMQEEFLRAVMSPNPSLKYFDPYLKDYKTIHYIADISETVHKGLGAGFTEKWKEREFWTGLVLTAEEKCEFAIVAQPEDASGAIGETAYFSVTVSGSDLTYRWQFYDTSTTSWGYVTNNAYSGLRTPTMGVPITATRDGYRYRCEIKDGNETIYSDEATLSVETE